MKRLVLILAALTPAAALAQDYYGAIAYSPRTGAHGCEADFAVGEFQHL